LDVHSEILNLQSEIGLGFHVRYKRQGSSVRMQTNAHLCDIETPYVQANPRDHECEINLLMEVNPK
jgi:hypothetical protein